MISAAVAVAVLVRLTKAKVRLVTLGNEVYAGDVLRHICEE